MMQPIDTVAALTALGRQRLSDNFFMREMLYSEVGNLYGISNIPEDPQLAVEAGSRLASEVLEPLRAAFGHIAVRSAYRSPTLNSFCHDRFKGGDTSCWCDCNEASAAHHIWDRRDADGYLGATATVVVPGYIEHYERAGDWRPLGWWIRDHVPAFADLVFFKHLAAFNIRWFEGPSAQSIRYSDPPHREILTARGEPDFERDHREHYANIIPAARRI